MECGKDGLNFIMKRIKNNKYKIGFSAIILMVITVTSCDKIFEFSPYEVRIDNDIKYQTNKNLDKLNNSDTVHPFKFAIIADNHAFFTSLQKVVDDINSDINSEIKFVIHAGDMTDGGLQNEYLLANKILRKINVPFFTVIGNHDCLTNGVEVYKQLYGDLNYSFEYMNNKFIFFNDNIWEFNNTYPDFKWLEEQLIHSQENKNIFVIAHIPPFTDQFNEINENTYRTLINNYCVTMSVHGHVHCFSYSDYYNDGVSYLTVENTRDMEYCLVKVDKEIVTVERVKIDD